ncbi:hypothetical protein DPMN_076171 [Dreissena polymorpha]|uniref:Uncharacterized protein n=1 Tax=Dreissena polymorpha TaxID=45954 RepID=A0A9D3YN77_DREPO|nr:hypothetical protein DPMN_076171 [Dreissena polymorpha]
MKVDMGYTCKTGNSRYMDASTYGLMNKWTDEWMEMDGWIDGSMDEYMDILMDG